MFHLSLALWKIVIIQIDFLNKKSLVHCRQQDLWIKKFQSNYNLCKIAINLLKYYQLEDSIGAFSVRITAQSWWWVQDNILHSKSLRSTWGAPKALISLTMKIRPHWKKINIRKIIWLIRLQQQHNLQELCLWEWPRLSVLFSRLISRGRQQPQLLHKNSMKKSHNRL